MNKFEEALADAERCIQITPTWPKGYNRKGFALFNLNRLEEAKAACEEGLKISPTDAGIKSVLDSVNQASNPMGQMFGPAMWGKLATDPTTAQYLKDPQFVNKMKMLQANPSSMTQLMQTDPQIGTALGVILGIPGLGGMGGGAGAPPPAQAAAPTPTPQETYEEREARAAAAREQDRLRAQVRRDNNIF